MENINNETLETDLPVENELLSSKHPVNMSSAEKYADNMSSAITFLVCGFAGLIILMLNDIGLIHIFARQGFFMIFTNVILGALFLFFIGIGIKSLIYSKKIKASAEKETNELEQILEWLDNNILPEDVDNSYDTDMPDEMKYFNRSEFLRTSILSKFPETTDAIIENASDTYIEKYFYNFKEN